MLVVFLLLRLLFVAFWVLTSLYCLFCFIPFTYIQVIQGNLVSFIEPFGRYHHWLFWPAVGAAAATLVGEERRLAGRILTAGFLAAMGLAGLALLARPVLPALSNDLWAFVWSQAALVPIVWVALIDFTSIPETVDWEARDDLAASDQRVLASALLAAVFVWASFSTLALVRFGGGEGFGLVAAGTASLTLHLVAGAGLFLLLMIPRGLAGLFHDARVELVLTATLLAVAVAWVLRGLVFAAVSFAGWPALLAAGTLAAALVAAVAGLAVCLIDPDGETITSGLALLLRPLAPRGLTHPVSLAGALMGILAVSWSLTLGAGLMDWNFLLQKLTAFLAWALAFGIFFLFRYGPASPAARPAARVAALLAMPIAALGLHKGIEAAERAAGREAALEQYAGRDAAYRLLFDALAPATAPPVDAGLYEFLQARTNIPRATAIDPVSVDFVPRFADRTGARAPHIFIFVIDSLRRDYLSPYNPRVTFTPAMARFAQEATVFRRAFTHYGATGLSEPSIWVGGLLPHKQYVTPFAPMNALEKLLAHEGYRRYVSLDTILRTILTRSPQLVEIDEGVATKDLDLCRSLDEMWSRIQSGGPDPIFVYTQPQNLHISLIAREGQRALDGGDYAGFYAPYASRLKRIDACLGSFLDRLRATPLYDESIIVLTSDHGDSLGEGGRWGHAYTLFPEIVQIPLVIRVPERLRAERSADADAPVFSTDITPTLYALLGHEPELDSEFFGRPLWVRSSSGISPPADDQLLVSSYGPVYGLLHERGRFLYVLDAVNFREHLYDLSATPPAAVTIEHSRRVALQKRLREKVEGLYRFYRVNSLD